LAESVAAPQRARWRGARTPLRIASSGWRSRISSHETFTHDSLESLGYDWERIGDPSIPPRYPLKIYLPETTEEIVAVVRAARDAGERLVVRSKGHSSNDLVLADRGSVLVTERLNKIVALDEAARTITVQAGAVSAQLDDYLAERGYGLPVIGDHVHITVGGFASVGGISPASHRFGLFVDNVERLEYVDWDGEVHACSRTEEPERFHRVLCGLGRYGVIATMTLRFIQIDKYNTIWENEQTHYRDREAFIAGSARYVRDPGDVMMERGLWVDFGKLAVGQFSAYRETEQSRLKGLSNTLHYGYLHGLGYVQGRLPSKRVDRALKYVSMLGVLHSPRFASIKNIEFFTEKILDSTVGDPTRMFIVLGPLERYETIFRDLWRVMSDARDRHDCFTFLSVYVKSIRSAYLGGGEPRRFCELMFYVGIKPERMTGEVLDAVVSEFDDVCIRHGAFRYMHSRTVKDPERVRRIDPNAQYAPPPLQHEVAHDGARDPALHA